MAKRLLQPGQSFTLIGGPVTVGLTGSVADLSIDWHGVEGYSEGEIGEVLDSKRFTYKVFRDPDTGKLFYDDECGY